jgi:hypothetical protein
MYAEVSNMASVELTTNQVIELVRQLPSQSKREVLLALAAEAESTREERMTFAERQFRRIAAERGLDWDSLPDDQRQMLADDLIHEDRPCRE